MADGRGGGDACDAADGGPGHSSHGERSARTLALVAAINVVGFFAELAGGLLFGSVALLSDAVHMLFDALAYGMAFAAASLAERYDASDRWSYGLHRLEPLSAFLNGVLLVPMVGYILYESVQRFLSPVDIATGPTIALAIGGLGVNVLSMAVLQGDDMNLNERGAYYHLLGDAGGSVAVIVSMIVVGHTGISVIDPVVAVLIAAVVLWSAGNLLRGSGAIFLHEAPVTRADVEARLQTVDGVTGLRDVHAWQICSEITVEAVQVDVAVADIEEAAAVTERLYRELADLGVDHATVELCHEGYDRGVQLNAHAHSG
ncbi:cation diffusion facilitator family transporter [Halanaeroarchaeum sulfurireducens]|uniref:Cation diffusion facilitator family transporter n=1 Tax=Halanaeroarchaeum sulfurireducens TaxID=1604004 RepID=A0A0N7FU05_9EURY|nr:cation diffusion facilitator family transporter [Halanaeroarchaeum sulfurireducens]ALG83015.1 cation diffusion facilitator family transporter [Halanaeroarchaeum sulfurireducens]